MEPKAPISSLQKAVEKHRHNVALVLDFGSPYAHLITGRVRRLSICSFCLSGTSPLSAIASLCASVIILSGGPHSLHQDGAPSLPEGFFEYSSDHGIHFLGICYGLQLIVKMMGGEVKPAESQEYGRMEMVVEKGSKLYGELLEGVEQAVWMSRGDEAVALPREFSVVARSLQNAVAAIENPSRRIYGLQYHPEEIWLFGLVVAPFAWERSLYNFPLRLL